MRSLEVVVVVPGWRAAFRCRSLPVIGIGPFAQSGLDKTFGFAVGLRR